MNKRRKRKQRILKLVILGILVLLIAAAAFLFQARTVDVYGNERHSSEEISGGLITDIFSKNTLYLLWKYKDGEIPDTLPFLSTLKIQMKSPAHIEVVVQEKELAGYVDKGEYVYFDKSGIVLQMTDEVFEDVPIVTGIGTAEPVLYQKLPTESSAQLRTILSLTQLLTYHELQAKEIRFSENMEITVFINLIEVSLGQDEYLEEKVANLKAILDTMEGNEKGVLHLESFTGSTMNVTFTPDKETEDTSIQTETDSESTNDFADTQTDSDSVAETPGEDIVIGGDQADDTARTEDTPDDTSASGQPFMAFDSSGTLRYDVRVVNGQAVDSTGTPVPGCSVNENGYVVDAYMNVIDPATGQPIQ